MESEEERCPFCSTVNSPGTGDECEHFIGVEGDGVPGVIWGDGEQFCDAYGDLCLAIEDRSPRWPPSKDPSVGIAAWIAGLKKEELDAVHHVQMLERLVEVRTAEPVELESMAGGSVRTSLYVDRPERLRAAIGELRAALRWLEGASL